MINSNFLRKTADKQKERNGEAFVIAKIPEIESEMKNNAEQGLYELNISQHSELNKDGWLSESHLYNPIISELQKYGYTVSHSDDLKDGTYMIIKW